MKRSFLSKFSRSCLYPTVPKIGKNQPRKRKSASKTVHQTFLSHFLLRLFIKNIFPEIASHSYIHEKKSGRLYNIYLVMTDVNVNGQSELKYFFTLSVVQTLKHQKCKQAKRFCFVKVSGKNFILKILFRSLSYAKKQLVPVS